MAARQQQKGTVSGIQYEVLVPKSEWKDQPEATLLTINLTGFAKEQIKVTYVHTSKMLRVTGERPVAGWRWIRFNELFSVPQNCLVDMIHGSFKNDVLTITMPKEKITTMANLPEASKTVAAQEKVEKLEEKMLLEEAKWKEKVEEAEQKKKQLLDEREELIRKLHEEAKAKEKYELMMRKLQEEVKAKEKPGNRNLVEGPTLEKIQERKSGGKERKLPEVVCTKSGPGSESGSGSAGGVGEVVKSAAERLGYLVEKEKKMGKGIIERIRRKEITSEEKKVMVNVGMAALVILALGAYVSYTFSSSSPTSSSSSPSSSSSSPSSSSSSPSSSSSTKQE